MIFRPPALGKCEKIRDENFESATVQPLLPETNQQMPLDKSCGYISYMQCPKCC